MNNPNPISVRVPHDLKQWLKDRAKDNCRTVSGEILALLKAKQADEATAKAA